MKKLISLIGMMFFLVTLLSAQGNEMDADAAKAYNEGNKLLKSGDYQGAITQYNEALKTSQDYRIYYQKGVALKNTRNYKDAIEAYNAALNANPNFGASYNGLGGIYYAQGDFHAAAENFKKFKESTDNAKQKEMADKYISLSYTKLGVDAKQNGNFQQAESYLKQAVENYNYDAAFLALAEVYVESAKFELALEAADKAINHRDKTPKGAPYYYKARAFQGLDNKEKAIENYKLSAQDSQYRELSNHHLKQLQQ
ncbi:MAG TPA: tetratricopeptide repeat protein [Ignavibacteria bacterium]|nr:tetratricopeptide repeat protein [Ignavibacteria bacterium]